MIYLQGKKVYLKSVVLDDAEFILNLRKDSSLNKFISSTSSDLKIQKKWIQDYLIREGQRKEIYFIIKNKNGKSCGTVRIYDIDYEKKECTWGSFILNKNRPEGSSYEVIKLSLNYAFKNLRMEKVILNVRKENEKAIHIYEKVGFLKVSEDFENYYYVIKENFSIKKI